jgi:hypothetical protein
MVCSVTCGALRSWVQQAEVSIIKSHLFRKSERERERAWKKVGRVSVAVGKKGRGKRQHKKVRKKCAAAAVAGDQGDRIRRIFAGSTIAYFRQCFKY